MLIFLNTCIFYEVERLLTIIIIQGRLLERSQTNLNDLVMAQLAKGHL